MPDMPNNNLALYLTIKEQRQAVYVDQKIKGTVIKTLAMMITGMLLGPHVQLFAIAMCIPLDITLPSLIRRFERFVADDRIQPQPFYEPFVWALIASLGNETASF